MDGLRQMADHYGRRIDKALEGAPVLSLSQRPRIVLFSDCHRGCGTWNDGFLPNKTLYLAALGYYWERGFTYIELGDGDELWENRDYRDICNTHRDVFRLLAKFQKAGRLYQLWGNHDCIKSSARFQAACLVESADRASCLSGLRPVFYESLILQDTAAPGCAPGPHNASGRTLSPHKDTEAASAPLCLIHGHQTDILNDRLWKVARFLVRYLWKPLELAGVRDPTSAARNYTRKGRTEARMMRWVQSRQASLIAGHTHRPMLPPDPGPCYYNAGSCVHPNTITCLELAGGQLSLIRWSTCVDEDRYLTVCREVIAGPKPL